MSNMRAFAEACHDQNSKEELTQALYGDADLKDMETWDLTEAQWREGLAAALIAKEKDISVEEALKYLSECDRVWDVLTRIRP